MSYARSPRAVCSTTMGTSVPAAKAGSTHSKSSLASALSKSRVLSSRIRARARQTALLLHLGAHLLDRPLEPLGVARDLGVDLGVRQRRRSRGARSRRAGCRPWRPSRRPRAATRGTASSRRRPCAGRRPDGQPARQALGARVHVPLDERVGHLEGRLLDQRLDQRVLDVAVAPALLRRCELLADRAARSSARQSNSPRSFANSSSAPAPPSS